MADPAHKETDKILEKIEKQIAKEYSQAEKEVSDKLDDYLKRFVAKDEKWQQWVHDGKKTKEEYQQWKVGQIAIGDRWRSMRDALAEDFHNTNEVAKSTVYGHMPDVYAINYNYGTYEIENGLGIDTSFTLYDRQTVERLFKTGEKLYHDPGLKKQQEIAANKDLRWNRQQIQSSMIQAILQGESIPKIASRIATSVGDKNRAAAIRNARTITTGVQNAGRVDSYKRAQDMGIEMKQQWVATLDIRTRESHRQLDGEVQPVNGTFSNGCKYPGDPNGAAEEIYNCFVGDVYVAADSDIEKSYKHMYAGDLITVKTAGGVEFTCTPKHPILTLGGWVSAQSLNEGDDICEAFCSDLHFARINPYVDHVFSRFDTVHNFFDISGGERTCTLSVNFHGEIPASNVEIISKKRLLRGNRDIRMMEKHKKLSFKNPDFLTLGLSHAVKGLWGVLTSSFRFMSGIRESLPFLWWRLRHPKIHGLRPIALFDAGRVKPLKNYGSCNAEILGECLDGFTGIVLSDKIVNIKVDSRCAHVYNLQTKSGYYFVNSIICGSRKKGNGNLGAIAHNCRCTLVAQLKGFENDISDLSLRNTNHLGDMSYAEWKAQKKSTSNRITLPEEKAEAIKWVYISEYLHR